MDPEKPNPIEPQPYAGWTLFAVFIGALATALLVPPAWQQVELLKEKQRDSEVKPVPPAPAAVGTTVCGVWRSETSNKLYKYDCLNKSVFDVYELRGKVLDRTGSGQITEEGTVEADIVSMPKNRRARLWLRLAPDGRTMSGSWRGDDPQESGALVFYRIE